MLYSSQTSTHRFHVDSFHDCLIVFLYYSYLGDSCLAKPAVVDEVSFEQPAEFNASVGHILVDGCETNEPEANYWLGPDV